MLRGVLLWLLGTLVLLQLQCGGDSTAPQEMSASPSNAASPLDVAQLAMRYQKSAVFRRQILDDSLVNKKNGYSRIRLAHYNEKGWGRLPVADFPTRPVVPADLGRPVPAPPQMSDAAWISMKGDSLPITEENLLKRGEAMFARYPAQLEPSMIEVLRVKERPAQYGLWQTESSVGGLVWISLPGGVYPALTCSSCHGSVDDTGAFRPGSPNHRINLGKAKDDALHSVSIYSTWGEGRVDVAADAQNNPIVIADVRAVSFQQYLHRTANVKNSLDELAMRIETGLILAHRQSVRPSPLDAFALAAYLWSLGDTVKPLPQDSHPGRKVFAKNCASCHQGFALAGKPVAASVVQSPLATNPSAVRGTGTLQAVSLRGVSDRQLLLSGGDADSFETLLSPNRTQGGHYFGTHLGQTEKRSLIEYLEAL